MTSVLCVTALQIKTQILYPLPNCHLLWGPGWIEQCTGAKLVFMDGELYVEGEFYNDLHWHQCRLTAAFSRMGV
jgi:hypothetical protein